MQRLTNGEWNDHEGEEMNKPEFIETIPDKNFEEVLKILNKQLDILKLMSSPIMYVPRQGEDKKWNSKAVAESQSIPGMAEEQARSRV
jgi:hypothetical protein